MTVNIGTAGEKKKTRRERSSHCYDHSRVGFSFWPDLSTKLMIHLRVLLENEEFLSESFKENNNSSLSSLKRQFAMPGLQFTKNPILLFSSL